MPHFETRICPSFYSVPLMFSYIRLHYLGLPLVIYKSVLYSCVYFCQTKVRVPAGRRVGRSTATRRRLALSALAGYPREARVAGAKASLKAPRRGTVTRLNTHL